MKLKYWIKIKHKLEKDEQSQSVQRAWEFKAWPSLSENVCSNTHFTGCIMCKPGGRTKWSEEDENNNNLKEREKVRMKESTKISQQK